VTTTMGFRITTWNVNGIRNPFGYQPWRDKRTFEGMFELLEADIVVFQETKIQRKDLKDDMVLVPGWDNYWSLPKHKKGRSKLVGCGTSADEHRILRSGDIYQECDMRTHQG
jgi:AP endonuclease 2